MKRDPRLRKERRVEFLGEQDGGVERELKSNLRFIFQRHQQVETAYLARVGFAPQSRTSVALCLVPKSAESRAIIDDVNVAFSEMFSEESDLDILFLTGEQEIDLQRVCEPFFQSPPKP